MEILKSPSEHDAARARNGDASYVFEIPGAGPGAILCWGGGSLWDMPRQ